MDKNPDRNPPEAPPSASTDPFDRNADFSPLEPAPPPAQPPTATEAIPAAIEVAAPAEPLVVQEEPAPAELDPANPDPAIPDSALPDPAIPDPALPDPAIPDPAIPNPALPHQISPEAANAAILTDSRRHTRRSFIAAGVGAAAAFAFYKYLDLAPGAEMLPAPIRHGLQFNAATSRELFRDHALAPTYPLSRAEDLRVNGIYGLKKALVAESYRLQLVGMNDPEHHPRFVNDVTAWQYRYTAGHTSEDAGHDTKVDPKNEAKTGPRDDTQTDIQTDPQVDPKMQTADKMSPESMREKTQQDENHTGRRPRGTEEAGESKSTLKPATPGLLLKMDDILTLPRHELVTQFKCIEGWSQIVHWAGVRMADFLEAYPPAPIDGKPPLYVYMETPDGDYYTGYDMSVMRHPQTLLVTEMMGAPLTQFHGAPLRLHMPTKYGYKQIKRIALIAYTNTKPDDYWTRLGYDWYAGL